MSVVKYLHGGTFHQLSIFHSLSGCKGKVRDYWQKMGFEKGIFSQISKKMFSQNDADSAMPKAFSCSCALKKLKLVKISLFAFLES